MERTAGTSTTSWDEVDDLISLLEEAQRNEQESVYSTHPGVDDVIVCQISLAILPVMLSAAKKRPPQAVACKEEILRCAQHDRQDGSMKTDRVVAIEPSFEELEKFFRKRTHLYLVTLSKIYRGSSRDIADVKLLVQQGIINLAELDNAYQEVLAQLGKGRYPRITPKRFTERYQAIRQLL